MGEEARRLADRIAAAAIVGDDGGATWVALRPSPEVAAPAPLDPGLHSGLVGIAVFMAAMARCSGAERYDRLARAAVHEASRAVDESPVEFGIGGGSGLGSVAFGLTLAGDLLGDPTIVALAERAALSITPLAIADDRTYDVIEGAAGAALGILAVHRRRPSAALLGLADACGAHLLRHAQREADGSLVWRRGSEPLPAGFAHGSAGIAAALTALGAACGSRRMTEAGRRVAASPNQMRGARSLADGWCTGTAGLALGAVSRDSTAHVDRLCATLLVGRGPWPDNLCCGTSGALDVLLTAGRALRHRHWITAATDAALALARRGAHSGYHLAHPGEPGTEDPSLFGGLAGIGYVLLRVERPELPSPLYEAATAPRQPVGSSSCAHNPSGQDRY
jgi:lantibiotic modifying enzyme